MAQIHELAERHSAWLRPRWLQRTRLWRDMMVAAAEDDAVTLERSRMQGLQILAAEARNAAHPGGRPPARSPTPLLQLQ